MDTIVALVEWFIQAVRNVGIPAMGVWVAWLMFWGQVGGFSKNDNAKEWGTLLKGYIGLIIVCILAWFMIGAIANIIFQGGSSLSSTIGF